MAGQMPTLKFLPGQSKNPIIPGICLIDDKYKFFHNKIISDGQSEPIALFYQCGMKKSTKCPASVVLTKLEDRWWAKNLSPDDVHNHASDRGAVLAHVMKKVMFEKVGENPETRAEEAFRDVVTDFEDRFGEEEQVWDEAVASLPSKENLARNMRHIRSKEHGPLPKNRDDFDPEVIVKSTVGGRKIIIMDSNKHLDNNYYSELALFENNSSEFSDDIDQFILDASDEDGHASDVECEEDIAEESSTEVHNRINERNPFYNGDSSTSTESSQNHDKSEDVEAESIKKKPKRIIAYTTKYLLKLFNQTKSSGDGTFKISPTLWKQVYIVMIKMKDSWVPICYALLPDKCKETYFTFFYMVKKFIKDLNIRFKIKSMRMDFEIGAMKAAAAAWKITVKGCYFHFTQSGWRFVQTNNMASAYLSDDDQEFKILVKCVLSLPHVPVEDLEVTLDVLKEKAWDFGESPEKYEFKDKLLTYIRQYWIDGPVPPTVWNCFHRKVDLTNNNNESHNNYLNNALQVSHPSPAKLTVALVKELTLAETTLRKAKSGAERVIKDTYKKLNRRRENLKKMYHNMERVEYLTQMGNIVMHIQLNKGQMAEIRMTNTNGEAAELSADDANESPDDINSTDGAEDERQTNGDSSCEPLGSENNTHSSEEGNHPYGERIIGQVANANGKRTRQYEEPIYKNKRCLSCRGKFNIRSKYQVCKLCDQLIHVNNNKKCMKMKKFVTDKDFICQKCQIEDDGTEEETDEEETPSIRTSLTDSSRHETNNTNSFLANLTIDGVLCDGLVFEELRAPEVVPEVVGGSLDALEEASFEATIDCSNCSFHAKNKADMDFHKQFPDVLCHVCHERFMTKEEMLRHIDVMHFHPCPICESVFLRSFEKRSHIAQNHKEMTGDNDAVVAAGGEEESFELSLDEHEFQNNIVRQSTLQEGDSSSKLVLQFVGDVPTEIKDLKKRRRKGAN